MEKNLFNAYRAMINNHDLSEAVVLSREASKALGIIKNIDAQELEDLLHELVLHYGDAAAEFDNDDFDKLRTNLNKAFKDWKNRAGN